MRIKSGFPAQLQWAPVSDRDKDGNTGEIVRIGMLVSDSNNANSNAPDRWGTGGVHNYGVIAGVGNITEHSLIKGIVVATNNQRRVSSTLANYVGIEQITATVTQATQKARTSSQSGGHLPQEDVAMVQIAKLTPYTPVRINLYNATRGTAPTVNVVTTGAAGGASFTSDACDHTPVANLSTAYFRSGLNGGRMRQRTDASATVASFANAFRDTIAVGDKVVSVPLRPYGLSFVNMDDEGDHFDIGDNSATNHMMFHVDELHLEKAGEEYVIGTFDLSHFSAQTGLLD